MAVSKGKVCDYFRSREFARLLLKIIIFLIMETIVIRLFADNVAAFTMVQGSSMEGNYHDGEILLINKIAYRREEPRRFDVVIVKAGTDKDALWIIKRVIGLPGETVRIDKNGNIYINDVILEEGYGLERIEEYRPDGSSNLGFARAGVTLREGEYFLLGDNRNNSYDSRKFGAVPMNAIVGKVVK